LTLLRMKQHAPVNISLFMLEIKSGVTTLVRAVAARNTKLVMVKDNEVF